MSSVLPPFCCVIAAKEIKLSYVSGRNAEEPLKNASRTLIAGFLYVVYGEEVRFLVCCGELLWAHGNVASHIDERDTGTPALATPDRKTVCLSGKAGCTPAFVAGGPNRLQL